MNFQTFMTGLLTVSLFTGLVTQAIKVLLKEYNKQVYPNTLASIVSVVLSIAVSVGYAIVKSVAVTPTYVVMTIALAVLGILCATVGYDKVIQAIAQIVGGNSVEKDE